MLKGIERQLRFLSERPEPEQSAESVQDDQNLFVLLEDLQEAISHHQVRP